MINNYILYYTVCINSTFYFLKYPELSELIPGKSVSNKVLIYMQ